MEASSPARLYASLLGLVLTFVGIVGFFYEASFDSGEAVPSGEVLGLLAVNGWHNLLHLVAGLVGLAAAGSLAASRVYALAFGALYTVIAIWGFSIGGGETILGLVIVNTGDNVLHLAVGLVGLAAGAASRGRPREAAAA
jgi:hypothetical protein